MLWGGGGRETSTPELQGLPGPHSTKAVLAEASVCALTYLVTHCHSSDCHHKHLATFFFIGNTTSSGLTVHRGHGARLPSSSTRSKRRVLRVAARRRSGNPDPQVRPVTWPPAPAGEGCGAAGTRPLRGPLGLSAARPGTFACNLGAGHMWESSGGGKAQSGPNHCLFGGVWAQVKNENGPILFE